ncbi:MAG: DUF4292 domain-containing protein [Bacteroidetes bacterium]|nr:DUF4292 domain-containing protein [Bacteroidota bacterium]
MKQYLKIVLFILPFLFACKTKKNIPHRPERCRLDYKSSRTLTRLLQENQTKFSTFAGKAKVKVVIDEKETEFNVALRMKKDSVIWATISVMGIEGIRFLATKDSIKFFDRRGKYYVGGYDTLTKTLKTEIDLEILQSLLIGNNVEFYEEDEKLRPGIDSCRYFLGTIRKRKLRKVMVKGKELKEPAQSIWMLDSTFKITRILFREFGSGREFDAHFTDFQNVDLPEGEVKNISVPFDLTFFIKTNNIITVHLEYTKASANKPQNFPFTIPEGYERIEKK